MEEEPTNQRLSFKCVGRTEQNCTEDPEVITGRMILFAALNYCPSLKGQCRHHEKEVPSQKLEAGVRRRTIRR